MQSADVESLSRNEAVALGSARAPRAADAALVAGFGLGTTEWFRVPPCGITRRHLPDLEQLLLTKPLIHRQIVRRRLLPDGCLLAAFVET